MSSANRNEPLNTKRGAAIRRRIVRSRILAHATMAATTARPMSSQSAGSST
jgi:hypothetical protein